MTTKSAQPESSVLELTERLFELIGLARENQAKLTAFAGLRSDQEHGAFMVVGQAPKGWVKGFRPAELTTKAGRDRVLQDLTQKTSKPSKLSGPFWSHVRDTAIELGAVPGGGSGWEEQISWTNLYRVAPDNGNPSSQLRAMQQGLCIQILWREVFLWRPPRILFLTGLPWAAPFIMGHPDAELRPYEDAFVQAVGRISLRGSNDVDVVVARHPVAKSGPRQDHTSQIVRAFDRTAA